MVRIIADTLSSLPLSTAEKLNIPMLPQIVIFGDKTFRDDTEMNSKTFLEMLVSSPALPKTAAPPPALYNPIFEKILSEDDSIIVVCPSAEVSGTVRSAEVAAKEFPGADIRIFDTRILAGSLGSIVLKADEWAKAGLNADQIIKNLQDMSSRENTYFYVDTLEYLRKGGRIGGAQALLGGILQVKPILTLRNGRVESLESQRTKKRALARINELVNTQAPHDSSAMVSVMHGNAENEANKLREELKISLGINEIPLYELTPAILTHSGPGALGVSFFKKETSYS
jgi:DegV family protein with EDD domain